MASFPRVSRVIVSLHGKRIMTKTNSIAMLSQKYISQPSLHLRLLFPFGALLLHCPRLGEGNTDVHFRTVSHSQHLHQPVLKKAEDSTSL